MNAREGAGLIGGMIQASNHLHPIWEGLSESDLDELRSDWADELDGPDPAVSTQNIEDSIANHLELGDAWRNLDQHSRDARLHAIRSIADEVSNASR